ncbi:MAG: TFIIB-type zinc ribbon-containing protein [Promethearchaeota archaeon]
MHGKIEDWFWNFFNQISQTDWGQYFSTLFNNFVDWFMKLDLIAQIFVGILIILGLILIGYIIYGILWLVYQIIKFVIVISIILVYGSIATIFMVFESFILPFKLISVGKYEFQWKKIGYHIQMIFIKAYHIKSKKMPQKPIFKENIEKKIKAEASSKDELLSVATLGANEENYKSEISANEIEQSLYCPNCGNKFSNKMMLMVAERQYTFCELCGYKIEDIPIDKFLVRHAST